MPSSYSDNLRIELIANGEQTGTWGSTTNNNLGTLIESAITGYVAIAVSGTEQALQALNGVEDQARNMFVRLTGTPTAGFVLYIPPAEKLYIIANDTNTAVIVRTSTAINNVISKGGTTLTIPAGKTMLVMSDGTDMHVVVDHVVGDLSVTGNLSIGVDAAITGDLIVTGGIGVLNGLVVTGGITADTLSLGTALPVASGGTGAETFTSAALLRGNGTAAISEASAADIVAAIGTTAVDRATNIAGGAANRIPYNTGANATSFIAAPTIASQFLKYNGTSLEWSELPSSGVLTFSGGTTGLTPAAATAGAITLGGTLIAANGGTGISTYAVGDILYANTTSTLTKLSPGTSGQFLKTNGAGAAPSWASAGGSGTVTSVAAGNGMSFTTITGSGSVTMGTPSTLTTSTSNAVTATSHTHAVTFPVTSVNSKTGAVSLTSADFLPSVGAVGSYALLAAQSLSTTAIDPGDTVAGSTMYYFGFKRGTNVWDTTSDLNASGDAGGTAPAGTWQAMGSVLDTANRARATLFLRIA